MDSYLKGRPKAQRFHANLPSPKAAQGGIPDAGKDKEEIVRAEPEADVVNAPDVDLVMKDGVVRRIVIHLEDGRRLELDCTYEGDEE
ncbi:MAG TPA: hypothetical protein PKI32_07275 [Opitutales bacterium]|nr:hypothetical protein [Opitutales bacterium]